MGTFTYSDGAYLKEEKIDLQLVEPHNHRAIMHVKEPSKHSRTISSQDYVSARTNSSPSCGATSSNRHKTPSICSALRGYTKNWQHIMFLKEPMTSTNPPPMGPTSHKRNNLQPTRNKGVLGHQSHRCMVHWTGLEVLQVPHLPSAIHGRGPNFRTIQLVSPALQHAN